MRPWQIFAIGTLVVIAAVFMPLYHASLAACGALVIVGVVAFGFLLHPRKDVFYLRTTTFSKDSLGHPCVEHGRIAVQVELTRLWILFVPTVLAVIFLVLTWAQDMHLNFNLIEALARHNLLLALFWRLGIAGLIGLNAILSTWISERWTLRDASACSARSLSIKAGRVFYAFADDQGEFYGGDAFMVAASYPADLARLVFYRPTQPDTNKIAMGCLFHRFVIVGHGLTDLDAETVQVLRAAPTTT